MSIMAAVAYLFGWVSGLVVFLISKEDRVARFHGMQSILFNFVYSILFMIVAMVILGAGVAVSMVDQNIGAIAMLISTALIGIAGLGVLLLLVWTMWKAFNDKMYKLPIIGGFAEKWSG